MEHMRADVLKIILVSPIRASCCFGDSFWIRTPLKTSSNSSLLAMKTYDPPKGGFRKPLSYQQPPRNSPGGCCVSKSGHETYPVDERSMLIPSAGTTEVQHSGGLNGPVGFRYLKDFKKHPKPEVLDRLS